MKRDSNWCTRLVILASLVGLVFAALSCGGKNAVVGLGTNNGAAGSDKHSVSGTPIRGTGNLNTITTKEIPTLPKWQQELLADPGWNQPYIQPRADTPMPAPSYALLMSETQKRLQNGDKFEPRLGTQTSGKGVTWTNQKTWVAPTATGKGEYALNYGGAAPWGCKNGSSSNSHSVEKNIAAHGFPSDASQVISYAEAGRSTPNQFSGNGGQSDTDSLSAVYQIFSSNRSADPNESYDQYVSAGGAIPAFAEISYRADGGAGSPGACNASVQAHEVSGFFWWRFNTDTSNLPGGNTTPLYNLLIAPSSEKSGPGTSAGPVIGRIQNFYLGNVTGCYGSGAIVGIDSTTSACAAFATIANDTANKFFFTNPIYGVLLKRWQDSVVASLPSGTDPWEASFGWPVFGPISYNNGSAVLTGNGAYYAWGMFFEKGFIWWIDYANNNNVPDEAQAYTFSGSNVYCADKQTYDKLPTIYYGGSGALGVSVIVEASLNPSRGPGTPAAGTFYEVGLPNAGLGTVALDMHAHGYGGTPRASDCAYKYYTWAYRDGSVGQTNGTGFDNTTQYVVHSYGSAVRNQESIYIARVQVVDSAGKIAYGDSLPIHVGEGAAGGGAGEITIVRNDGGTAYQKNLDALTADLTTLGAKFGTTAYTATIADDTKNDGHTKLVIWYRGGPGGAGETQPYNTVWTAAETDQYIKMMNNGIPVWLMSQSNSLNDQTFGIGTYNTNGWAGIYGYSVQTPSIGTGGPSWGSPDLRRHAWAASYGTDDGIGFGGSYGFIPCAPTDFIGSPDGRFGSDGTQAAERYTGANSSTKTPITLGFGDNRQFCGVGFYSPFFAGSTAGPNTHFGVNANPQALGYDLGFLSYGNSAAPDHDVGGYPSYQHHTGPTKLWCTGYDWAETTITASNTGNMTRADLARNILASLNGALTFSGSGGSQGAVTNKGFQEYAGEPDIVSVTPAYWDEANHMYRAGGNVVSYYSDTANGGFPDQTAQDVYRSTDNPALSNEIITTDANNNWKNGNDVDFEFPAYAYVDDGANNVVEIGGTSPLFNSTDDSVFYAGLKLNDPDASWARFTPAGSPSIMLKEAFNNTNGRSPIPVVSGYYKSTNVGTSADDIYASYGTNAQAFDNLGAGLEWKNNKKLTVEAIAHWPASLQYFAFAPFNSPTDPSLYWSMYPGQNMVVPGTSNIIGVNADWDAFRSSFDIDPSFAVALRTGNIWNRPSFNFTNPASNGRVVEFSYNKVSAWNPDLDRSGGARTVADKFPIRCRLFKNHLAYYTKDQAATSKWPNHLNNPGLNPATTPIATRLPNFIEAGCYVEDFGDPAYPVQVIDDPAQPDPGFGNTIHGTTFNYQMDLYFTIKFGVGPFKLELDSNYNGVFDTAVPGGYGNAGAMADAAINGNVARLLVQIPVTQPNNAYTFAVRVTDQGDSNRTAVFAWPQLVQLFPPALLRETFEAGNLNQWTLTGAQGSVNQDFINTNTTHPYWGFGAQQGSRYCMYSINAGTNGYGDNCRRIMTAGPIACTPNTNYTQTFYTNGYCEGFWDGLMIGYYFGATNAAPSYTQWQGLYYAYPSFPQDFVYGEYLQNGYDSNHCYGADYSLGNSTWRSWSRTYNSGPSGNYYWMKIAFTSDPSVNTFMGSPAIDNIVVQ